MGQVGKSWVWHFEGFVSHLLMVGLLVAYGWGKLKCLILAGFGSHDWTVHEKVGCQLKSCQSRWCKLKYRIPISSVGIIYNLTFIVMTHALLLAITGESGLRISFLLILRIFFNYSLVPWFEYCIRYAMLIPTKIFSKGSNCWLSSATAAKARVFCRWLARFVSWLTQVFLINFGDGGQVSGRTRTQV